MVKNYRRMPQTMILLQKPTISSTYWNIKFSRDRQTDRQTDTTNNKQLNTNEGLLHYTEM